MQARRNKNRPWRLFDLSFLEKVRPFFNLLEKYFRYEVRGLENIPKNKACLVVMNHGIIPFHGFLLAKKIIEDLKLYPRELTASFIYQIPGVKEFFLKGGAVNATPANAERLLRRKNIVIVSPGGIYEALITHKGVESIPWESRKGFVREAVKMNVLIVPTYCQGISSVYYNSRFLLKLRLKLLEKTRFSFPFFFGIGLFPFPIKLIHRVGKPISVARQRGETKMKQIERIHQMVIAAEAELANHGRIRA